MCACSQSCCSTRALQIINALYIYVAGADGGVVEEAHRFISRSLSLSSQCCWSLLRENVWQRMLLNFFFFVCSLRFAVLCLFAFMISCRRCRRRCARCRCHCYFFLPFFCFQFISSWLSCYFCLSLGWTDFDDVNFAKASVTKPDFTFSSEKIESKRKRAREIDQVNRFNLISISKCHNILICFSP